MSRQGMHLCSLVATLVVLTMACWDAAAQSSSAFVGSIACAECHEAESDSWLGSHHQLAWQDPSRESVLGNFEDARFMHRGVETRFFRSGEKYFVETSEVF